VDRAKRDTLWYRCLGLIRALTFFLPIKLCTILVTFQSLVEFHMVCGDRHLFKTHLDNIAICSRIVLTELNCPLNGIQKRETRTTYFPSFFAFLYKISNVSSSSVRNSQFNLYDLVYFRIMDFVIHIVRIYISSRIIITSEVRFESFHFSLNENIRNVTE